jgi:hypothetical protein
MKFPTFVVLAFDHTRKPVNSLRDYRRLADHWKEKVQAFHKNDGLKHVLGIAHKEGEWRNVPSLTFVAFSTIFDEPDFWNFYLWNWKNGPEDVKLPFLRDIRIQGFSGSTYPSELVLDQCHNIIYEYNLNLPITRYYYSSIPLFDLDNNWSIHDQFPLHGTGGILTRILRTALFVNVTLPSMVDLSKVLKDSLGDNFYKIQKMRMEIFNDFTQSKLDSSHAEVRLHADWHQGVIREIDRIDEIQKGFSKLLEDIQQPFTPPISHPSSRKTQDTSSKGENHCLDLFHFHKTYNTVNDSNKAFEYIRDITDNRNSIEINQRRFENEVSNTSTLLESRRALLQDRRNTLVAIIVPAFGAFIFGLGLLFLGQYLWPWR